MPFLALVALCIAASQSPAPPQAQPKPQRVAFVLDGEPVSEAEYAEWMLHTQGAKLARTFAEEHWLVEREARRRDVAATDAQVDLEVQRAIDERIRGAFHGRREEWLDELARTDRTELGLRRQRRTETRDLLDGRALAAIDRVVPRDKIEREWWLSYGRHGKKLDLLMLKLGVRVEAPPDVSNDAWKAKEEAAKAARLADARRIRALIVAGADFGQLAQESSTDPDTRDRRGRPSGGFDWQGWPPAFLDAIEALEPGALSEPLYARGGWWLVKVRKVDVTPLEKVKDELAARLLARGPEDDEVASVKRKLAEGVEVKLLPGLHGAPSDPELSAGDVAAISIDGEPVTRTEYGTWILDTLGETFARTYAEEILVRRKAKELGVSLEPGEVLARARADVQAIVDTDFQKNRERWYESLAHQHRTEEDFVREHCLRLETNLLVEKLMFRERSPTEEDLRRRFASSYDAEGTRREVSVILVSSRSETIAVSSEGEDRKRKEAEAFEKARLRAVDLVARLRAGADFAATARAESDDIRTNEHGGTSPGRFRADVYTPEIGAAVEALAPGAISDPLPFGTAWLVFQLRSVRHVRFEDVRDELRQEIVTEPASPIEIQAWKNGLAKKHSIRVGDPGVR